MKSFNLLIQLFWLTAILTCGCEKAQETKSGEEMVDYTALRAEVVKNIKSGELKSDTAGVVTLPEKFKAASMGGVVVVSTSASTGKLVVFKTMSGRNVSLGLLYSEKGIAKGNANVTVGSFPLTIVGRTDEHWYRVSGPMP
jgi:hypothetical protein